MFSVSMAIHSIFIVAVDPGGHPGEAQVRIHGLSLWGS